MLSRMLDVAIGVILVFTVLSISASALSEVISNFLQRRARLLEGFLEGLLVNSGLSVKDFYEKTILAPHAQSGQRPAYVQASDFADAIFTLLRTQNAAPNAAPESQIPDFTLAEFKQVVTNLKDSPLKKVLLSIIVKAEDDPNTKTLDDLERVRVTLEHWYDNSMDRVSGWYKGHTQFILLGIGLIMAFLFNVDTLNITNALLKNPDIGAAIVKNIGPYTQTVGQSSALAATPQTGATPAATPAAGTVGSTGATDTQPISLSQADFVQQFNVLNIPIGWTDATMKNATLYDWITKIVGLLITGFAVSQGAPFWFDLLNKVTNLRSAGNQPAKS